MSDEQKEVLAVGLKIPGNQVLQQELRRTRRKETFQLSLLVTQLYSVL